MTTHSVKLRSARSFLITDRGAAWAFRVAMAFGVAVLIIVGRNQWFVRDDWALVITRNTVRDTLGWKDWLFVPQDGHWLTVPVLLYRGLQNALGLDSYVPFLALAVVTHIAAVLLVRIVCRRCGVSPWTTTIVCTLLLLFGAGWENIVFAVQVTYNLSLVAFLAQLVLADHDGPVDRRDVAGAGLAVIGAMSSGFAPVFITGIAIFLAFRRRWAALAVAVLPQGIVYLWWYVFWQSGSTSGVPHGSKALVSSFVAQGLGTTLHSMVVLPGLAGVALLATIGIALWRGTGWKVQSTLLALWATAAVMLIGIGIERVGFGVDYATTSRYQYMTAMLVAPAFALAVEQLARVATVALWAGRIVLAFAVLVNLGWLVNNGDKFAAESQHEKGTFELIAGSGLIAQADAGHIPELLSSDVSVRWVPWLVEQHAITARVPANQAELDRARAALGLPSVSP